MKQDKYNIFYCFRQATQVIIEKILLILKSTTFLHGLVSVVAGVVSFILAEEDKTWRSFFAEIVLAVFVGVFIASPLAAYFGLGQQLTTAVVAMSAVTARRLILFIKSNYASFLEPFIKKNK